MHVLNHGLHKTDLFVPTLERLEKSKMPCKDTKYKFMNDWEWDVEEPEVVEVYQAAEVYEELIYLPVVCVEEDDDEAQIEWEEAVIERHNRECDEIDAFRNAVAHYVDALERQEAFNRSTIQKVITKPFHKKWRKPWPMPVGL